MPLAQRDMDFHSVRREASAAARGHPGTWRFHETRRRTTRNAPRISDPIAKTATLVTRTDPIPVRNYLTAKNE
jgi:hypothetical protein